MNLGGAFTHQSKTKTLGGFRPPPHRSSLSNQNVSIREIKGSQASVLDPCLVLGLVGLRCKLSREIIKPQGWGPDLPVNHAHKAQRGQACDTPLGRNPMRNHSQGPNIRQAQHPAGEYAWSPIPRHPQVLHPSVRRGAARPGAGGRDEHETPRGKTCGNP